MFFEFLHFETASGVASGPGLFDVALPVAAGAALLWIVRKNHAVPSFNTQRYSLLDPQVAPLGAEAFLAPLFALDAGSPPDPRFGAVEANLALLSFGAKTGEAEAGLDPMRVMDAAFSALMDEVFVFAPDSHDVLFMNSSARARCTGASDICTKPRVWELIDGLGVNRLELALTSLLSEGGETVRVNALLGPARALFEVRALRQDGRLHCYVGVLKRIPLAHGQRLNEILIAGGADHCAGR